MESIGVAVGIIYDNLDENPEKIIMSDDGTGGGIQIPSMIISKTDGKKLKQFFRESTESELEQLAIMASFEMEHPDDRVEYDLWITSSNDKALDFIADFGTTDKELGKNVPPTINKGTPTVATIAFTSSVLFAN